MKKQQTPLTEESSSVKASVIVDNQEGRRSVGEFLRDNATPGSNLSVVSAYFTIYAYKELREVLEKTAGMRFLFGEPTAVGAPDPGQNVGKSFKLNEDGGIDLKHALTQKPLARDCADWIRRQVEIRTIKRANFLHGKLYHVTRDNETAALVGSSNFTRRGLGFGAVPNIELNLDVRGEKDRVALLDWFDELWQNKNLTGDAKQDVITALERLSQPYAPEFVYYKTLFHVFKDRLERLAEQDGLIHDAHLLDTNIWKHLHEFQRHGATIAINRLLRHNGCILADSVGLGKTWTALAVIKFFELRNERVLVLCPKRLENNWIPYTALAASKNNRFADDRFSYLVRAHTDLSRYEGWAGAVDLAQFNWSIFDLIVIDESHNFRNEGLDRKDEAGNLVRRSRYNRLLEEVLKGGVQTKVLMLSATPVNTSLRDLRNQIYLMTEKREDAFRDALGIGNIQSMFGVAQREFQKWETDHRSGQRPDKTALLEKLGAEFLTLLDAVTIARSREHVRRYYREDTEKIGGFPKRSEPKNLFPPTDIKGELSYDDLHQRIGDFQLSIYKPSQYLKDKSRQDTGFNQSDRENSLIKLMRVNLLKRLESSVEAFRETMKRILKKMEEIDTKINEWKDKGGTQEIDSDPYDDVEDDEFVIGKGRIYRLDELEVERWQRDISKDREIFNDLNRLAEQVDVGRDAKLVKLKEILRCKILRASCDKNGRANRKALVFTAFSDTADYLYDNLRVWAREALDIHIGLIKGGNNNRSTAESSQFIDILKRFAPQAQEAEDAEPEIDILIATDCLSEGQNLQDCDLVVNYDIHWNPVRLMQRFGRIDRLGSRNKEVAMINFWPTPDLDQYLNLKSRVEARMALSDATASGQDNPLSENQKVEDAKTELAFRDRQLVRMLDEVIDVEEADDSIGLTDFTLDDFIADLLQYVQKNRVLLEAAPFGIHAVVAENTAAESDYSPNSGGAIFCLKRNDDQTARTPNRLWPYFLVHVREDGSVRYSFPQAKQCLALFQALASGRAEAETALEDAFDRETKQGRYMKKYEAMLSAALRNIAGEFRAAELDELKRNPSAVLTKKTQRQNPVDEFTLVTWLVISKDEMRS